MPLAPASLGRGHADLAHAFETEPAVQAYRSAAGVLPARSTETPRTYPPPQGGRATTTIHGALSPEREIDTGLSRGISLPLAPPPGIALQRAAQALAESHRARRRIARA